MCVHNKEMQLEIRVERLDPRFAHLLQEQFVGENGELKAAMQYFTQVNFPPGQAPGDEGFQNVAFNEGKTSRGPWNQGQGPWPKGIEWEYVKSPTRDWLGGSVRQDRGPHDNPDGSPAVQSEKPFAHE